MTVMNFKMMAKIFGYNILDILKFKSEGGLKIRLEDFEKTTN